MYLGLGVDASHIHAGYPTDDTQVTKKILKRLHLRGFHPLRQDIPVKLQLHIKGSKLGLITPHLPIITHRYSVCPLPFSLAVTNGIAYCFLFLCLLRCFNSAGSRSTNGAFPRMEIGRPIRQPWVQRMHAPRPGISLLAATFISTSSQAIPQMV